MVTTERARAASAILAVMLVAGFGYSGVATLRHLRRVFQVPAPAGRSASIDAYLAPVNLSSGEDLRRAVRCLGTSTEEIVLLADNPTLSREGLLQFSAAAGYLLYPHRIVVVTESDATKKHVVTLSLVQRQ
jgi:hypothetical protein